MLLSLKYNFLFIHNAKTGGTSIRKVLQPYRWCDLNYIPQFICSRLSSLTNHRIGAKFPRHAKAIAAQEMLPHDLYLRLFKFIFVRNPWDLQVSAFFHLQREHPDLVAHVPDFGSFLRWTLDPNRPFKLNIDDTNQVQTDYMIDLHGNIIVDFIGRYERLDNDFSEVCQRIGIKVPKIPEERKSIQRKRDYRSYYTDDLAELVATRFKRDIEQFQYRFDFT